MNIELSSGGGGRWRRGDGSSRRRWGRGWVGDPDVMGGTLHLLPLESVTAQPFKAHTKVVRGRNGRRREERGEEGEAEERGDATA